MKESRRDFIKTSAALGVLSVTKASAQAALQPAVAKTIGFVVSTKDKANHIAAFLQALNDGGWEAAGQKASVFWLSAEGEYGPMHDELKNHAKRHLARNVNMIVAAGGLPAAVAVAAAIDENNATTPFIYLIGRRPTSNTGDDVDAAPLYKSNYKAGGVDQNLPALNKENLQLLKTHGVAIDKVGLIVNDNNPITKPEVTAWKNLSDPVSSQNPDPKFIFDLQGENEQSLPVLLKKIRDVSPQKPDGIVVSSDPYLRSVGADFDAQLRAPAGGNFTGWVCYPYKEYLDPPASAQSIQSTSTPALATEDPTDLNTAYYQLGKKTAQVLDQLKANPHAQPDAGVVMWDGMKWCSVQPDGSCI
jgi:hypothetical protein